MGTTMLAPSLFDARGAGTLFDEPEVTTSSVTGPAIQAHPDRDPAAGPTLEDVIVAAWEGIATGSNAVCPVCDGSLKPVWSAGPRPVGGHCQDCGSRLS